MGDKAFYELKVAEDALWGELAIDSCAFLTRGTKKMAIKIMTSRINIIPTCSKIE